MIFNFFDNNTGGSTPTPTPTPVPTRSGGAIFYDYDGTKLYEYTNSEVANLSALPAQPTHTGLTAAGWNWTLSEIQTQLTADSEQPVIVGSMYSTTSGATEIDVTLDSNHLNLMLLLTIYQNASIDWGDGSSLETETWTESGANYSSVYATHIYAQAGDYTIKIYSVTDGGITLKGGESGRYCFIVDPDDINLVYDNTYNTVVTAIRCGNNLSDFRFSNNENLATVSLRPDASNVNFSTSALLGCRSLVFVALPATFRLSSVSNLTSIFYDCISMVTVSIPSGIQYIGSSMFQSCYTLQNVTIPNGVKKFGSAAFMGCRSIQYITIPNGVEDLLSEALRNCGRLISATIPSGVTTIADYLFYG